MGLLSRKTCWPPRAELSTLALPKTAPAQRAAATGQTQAEGSASHRTTASGLHGCEPKCSQKATRGTGSPTGDPGGKGEECCEGAITGISLLLRSG